MNSRGALILFTLGALAFPATSSTAAQPNFVVIMGEAQGWASMSAPLDDRNVAGSQSDYILTPHLDSIAKAGVRFSDFYAASPRCTPTRAALFTGRSPAALHMTFVGEGKKDGTVNPGDKVIPPSTTTELPAGIDTIGTLLKKAGYATAHFGKWHAGRVNPKEHGFDENDGANTNGGPDNVESPNPKQCYEIARLGMDFITRQAKSGKPFYLQLSQYPGKGPETALPETLESVKKRLGTRLDFQRIGTAAGNEEIDKTIGQVLEKLKELGLTNNTYIIYTADHGAQGRNANGALTNGKGTVWEGGLRVPLLVAGPGIKDGAFSHVRASTVDVLPTIAELARITQASLPKNLEGVSLVNTLKNDVNTAPQRAREEYVVHFPHYDKDDIGPASAILMRNYKLIRVFETEERHLFDLNTDIAEKHDLAGKKPDIVKTMDNRMTDYLRSVDAGFPKPNPNYDPKGERSGDRKGGKAGGGGMKGKKQASALKNADASGTQLSHDEVDGVDISIGFGDKGVLWPHISGNVLPTAPGQITQHGETGWRSVPSPSLIAHPSVQTGLIRMMPQNEWLTECEKFTRAADLVYLQSTGKTFLKPCEANQGFGQRATSQRPWLHTAMALDHPAESGFARRSKDFDHMLQLGIAKDGSLASTADESQGTTRGLIKKRFESSGQRPAKLGRLTEDTENFCSYLLTVEARCEIGRAADLATLCGPLRDSRIAASLRFRRHCSSISSWET